MTDITISVTLPEGSYRVMQRLAKDIDRSARNYARRIIVEHTSKYEDDGELEEKAAPQPSHQLVIPPRAANMPAMKHCRKCSERIPLEEYNDFDGYCEQHGKKTA